MSRTVPSIRAVFLTLVFVTALPGLAAESFSIAPATSRWEAVKQPMPGVQAVYYRKGDMKTREPASSLRPNITVLRDTSAVAYASLDDYVSAAVKVLEEQGVQKVQSVTPVDGRYFVVRSRKGEEALAQAIYFKRGFGFYVVTASAPAAELERLSPEIDGVFKSGRFR